MSGSAPADGQGSGDPPRPPLADRAVRSFFWAGFSLGGSRLLVFLATLLLTRLLAPSDFGVVAAGLTLVAFLEITLDLGVGAALVYEQERGITDRVRTAFTLNLVLATALAALGALSAPGVAALFQSPEATDLFRVLCLYLVLRGAGQVQAAVLQRDLRFRERAYIEFTRASVRAVVSVVLALVLGGPWAIVGGLLAGECAGLVLASSYVRLVPAVRLEAEVVRTLLRFGLAVMATKVVSAVLTNSDKLIVGSRLGPEPLGFYVIAFRLPELTIDIVGWIFSSVAFALYSRIRRSDPLAFGTSMLKALRLTTLFGFSAGVGLAVIAPLAVPVLFSERWQPSAEPMVYLALAAGLASIGYASGDIFPAIGRPGMLLKLNLWTTPLAVVGFWFAAPHGLGAVAGVHLAYQAAYAVLRLQVAARLLQITWKEEALAMRPGVVSVLGVLAAALPVTRLPLPPALGLVLAVSAGVLGALLSLLAFARKDLLEVVGLVRRGALR